MGWATGIAVYLVVWWIAIFAVLPWGITTEQGGAPAKPNLRLKFLITSVVAAMIWLVIYVLVKMDIIDFYRISEQMIKEDIQ